MLNIQGNDKADHSENFVSNSSKLKKISNVDTKKIVNVNIKKHLPNESLKRIDENGSKKNSISDSKMNISSEKYECVNLSCAEEITTSKIPFPPSGYKYELGKYGVYLSKIPKAA